MLQLVSASTGLLLPSAPAARAPAARMACVDEFSISREIKAVRIFDGDYASDIRDEVIIAAKASIAEKGSFSLCIPGGSVVAAVKELEADAFDFSKTHIFLANEKIPSYVCIDGAIDAFESKGVPKDQIYGFDKSGSPADAAAKYSEMLKTNPSIDNSGALPSFDMLLLGTGPDGHVGCLFPDGEPIKKTGAGEIVIAGNDERADGDFLAISMDMMCATKTVIVSAAAEGRKEMVATALSGEFGAYDCPAGMVEAAGETLWFTDTGSISAFDADIEDEEAEAE